STPSLWKYAAGALTPSQREQLAKDYESGNGYAASKALGEQDAGILMTMAPGPDVPKIAAVLNDASKVGKAVEAGDGAAVGAVSKQVDKGAAVVTKTEGSVAQSDAAKSAAVLNDGAKIGKAVAANAATAASLKLDLQTTQAANEVVDSLKATGQLPSNYMTKTEAMQNGWKPGKALNNTMPGGQFGGDVFENSTNVLPTASGRIWREVDIGISNTMSRSNQPGTRLLYSSDGLLYITTDHYKTVTKIGTWK
uniref:ribonuclease domain-containing protein n=1 Tax=Halothiobacillus sp. TaxID=1891311 RepID=UPI002AD4C376